MMLDGALMSLSSNQDGRQQLGHLHANPTPSYAATRKDTPVVGQRKPFA